MAVPDYQTLLLPLLELGSDGNEYRVGDAVEALADRFGLSEEDRRQLLASGTETLLANRVWWARTYLVKAGLLERTRPGYVRITERGRKLLAERPQRLRSADLLRFPEFREWHGGGRKRRPDESIGVGVSEEVAPEELLAGAYRQLRSALAEELLSQVKSASPRFFERLVVDLLVAMGYGGSREEAGRAVGRSGDEGIDGIIAEDRLGLDLVYIQAKRWDRPVGRPEVQGFAGALQGQRARKGIMLTTSTFTKEAREYASKIDTRIVLIDGAQLVELMIDHGVGVTTVRSYEIKRVDTDYFSGE